MFQGLEKVASKELIPVLESIVDSLTNALVKIRENKDAVILWSKNFANAIVGAIPGIGIIYSIADAYRELNRAIHGGATEGEYQERADISAQRALAEQRRRKLARLAIPTGGGTGSGGARFSPT